MGKQRREQVDADTEVNAIENDVRCKSGVFGTRDTEGESSTPPR